MDQPPEANAHWGVVHSGAEVLEIPWSFDGYGAAPAQLAAGHTYRFTLLDEEDEDIAAIPAQLSDREHKDWADAVYDSKSYRLARVRQATEWFSIAPSTKCITPK